MKHNGFTLLELMIVIAIISILAAIAIPVYKNYTKKTNDAVCLSEMKFYASLYVSEKLSENGNLTKLPSISELRHCNFEAPTSLSLTNLIATAINGTGNTINCNVNNEVACEIN